MNIVIVGGNECMECRYKNLCKKYNCRVKVFTKANGTLKNKMGALDLLVLFTNTVSHKMAVCATNEAKNRGAVIARAHTSSMEALRGCSTGMPPYELPALFAATYAAHRGVWQSSNFVRFS
jgi:hypothetical protein